MSANFEECWGEFRRRTFPRYAAFIQLFKEKHPSAFENATSILDIGAGDGDFDVLLIKNLLPQLSEYNAVESDGDLCKTLEQKISQAKNGTIQVNVFNGFMEAYDGPREPVDLIVMCAVAYYIPDKKAMVHQALNWLKSGGHFIMIHWPHDTPIQKGQDTIRAANSSSIDASFDGVPLLQEMKIKHTEHKIDVPFDVTKDGLEKVLRIVLHRTPTEQETEEFSSAMKPYAELKDERVYVNMPYSIIVIQKDSST